MMLESVHIYILVFLQLRRLYETFMVYAIHTRLQFVCAFMGHYMPVLVKVIIAMLIGLLT